MLNRRHLRMKVMQALYSFEQAKTANYQLCIERIKHAFDPDWNDARSEELTAERAQKTQQVLQIFRENYGNEHWVDTTLPADIRRVAQQYIKEYHINVMTDKRGINNGLMREVYKLYDNYLLLLALPAAIAEFASADRDGLGKTFMRKGETKGDFKFVQNPVVKFLAQYEPLQLELKKRSIQWAVHEDLLRDFYLNVFRQDKTYQQYNESKWVGFEEERELVAYIYKNMVFTQQNLMFFSLKEFDIKRFELERKAKAEGIDVVRQQVFAQAEAILKSKALALGVEVTQIQMAIESFQKHLKEFAQHLYKQQPAPQDKDKEKEADTNRRAPRANTQQEREGELMERRFTQGIRNLHAILREATQQIVAHISAFLDATSQNVLDNQRFCLDTLEETIHSFLAHFGLGNHPQDKITLQTETEKGDTLLQDLFQELDYNWIENGKVVQNMVMKTIRMIDSPQPTDFSLVDISANWDDDKVFYQELFQYTIEYSAEAEKQLSKKSQNWEVSRMADLDRIIMKMAIAEMVHFTSIPVKVSINEYLEMAKMYSTPRSKQFINGLLDQVSQSMQKEGTIRKSGRGLMDNK